MEDVNHPNDEAEQSFGLLSDETETTLKESLHKRKINWEKATNIFFETYINPILFQSFCYIP